MSDEIMPNIRTSLHSPDVVWIDNLTSDRHFDTLIWTDPAASEGDHVLELTEAQARYLRDKLSDWLAARAK